MTGVQRFGDRVIRQVRALGHPLCVGLDPHLDLIPTPFRSGTMDPAAPETAASVAAFLHTVIDLLAGSVAAVKPQVGLFERLGPRGFEVLQRVTRHARAAGLLVVLDAKRGDDADTSTAYSETYLGAGSEYAADALTVSPFLGPDTLVPFFLEADREHKGVVVLLRDSNPGSAAFHCVITELGPYYRVVAKSLGAWQDLLAKGETGWSSLGVTVTATHEEDTMRIRAMLPRSLFFVQGYGAQGATARESVIGFRRGPSGLEGGLVNACREILFPTATPDTSAAEWEGAIRDALRRSIHELGTAVA